MEELNVQPNDSLERRKWIEPEMTIVSKNTIEKSNRNPTEASPDTGPS